MVVSHGALQVHGLWKTKLTNSFLIAVFENSMTVVHVFTCQPICYFS